MSNKFDFDAAQLLVAAVRRSATLLNDKNNELSARFKELQVYFSDAAYENLTDDMKGTDRAVQALLEQMEETARSIENYAERLRDAL